MVTHNNNHNRVIKGNRCIHSHSQVITHNHNSRFIKFIKGHNRLNMLTLQHRCIHSRCIHSRRSQLIVVAHHHNSFFRQPPAYGQQQPGYGQQPPTYGQQQPSGYGNDHPYQPYYPPQHQVKRQAHGSTQVQQGHVAEQKPTQPQVQEEESQYWTTPGLKIFGALICAGSAALIYHIATADSAAEGFDKITEFAAQNPEAFAIAALLCVAALALVTLAINQIKDESHKEEYSGVSLGEGFFCAARVLSGSTY